MARHGSTQGRMDRMREWAAYRRERRAWRRERRKGSVDPGAAPLRTGGAAGAASTKGAPADGPAGGFGGGGF
jgi:hypothetical protein